MKRTHPTILNPIHYEHVRYPIGPFEPLLYASRARQVSVCCTYQGGSLTRHLRIFAAHISFPFVSSFAYPVIVFDKNLSYLLQLHMYTFAHKKKREQHRDAFIRTRVFIFGHKVFKGEANILSALMSLAQADFSSSTCFVYIC